MKRQRVILIFFAAILISVLIFFLFQNGIIFNSNGKIQNSKKQNTVQDSDPSNISQFEARKQTSLFVPYWQLTDGVPEAGDSFQEYDRIIYFGITGNLDGVVKSEPGYQKLTDFVMATANKQTFLTVRLTDSDTNAEILTNPGAQEQIIQDTLTAAKENNFNGIVLDFEYTTVFNDEASSQINTFYRAFSGAVRKADLTFAVTLYGDLFYRNRPYDVKTIASLSDEVLIMAYDFHKSRGEPGPNFPLNGKEKYGYDYEQLIADFTKEVKPEKLTVIFGMYGYDWKVDEKKRPIRQGSPLTLAEIQSDYLQNCEILNCVVLNDPLSAETEIDFVDQYSNYHIIWFENKDSVYKKTKFLQEKGIGSIAYWAWGYF